MALGNIIRKSPEGCFGYKCMNNIKNFWTHKGGKYLEKKQGKLSEIKDGIQFQIIYS